MCDLLDLVNPSSASIDEGNEPTFDVSFITENKLYIVIFKKIRCSINMAYKVYILWLNVY